MNLSKKNISNYEATNIRCNAPGLVELASRPRPDALGGEVVAGEGAGSRPLK